MVSPITDDERRQLYIGGTVAMAAIATFWLGAFAVGEARWVELLLPLGLLALMVHALTRVRRPRLSRWALWTAVALITGGGVYAVTRVWGMVHHVSG